jgi:hypothetical protein
VSIDQSGSSVGRDQAGRDIVKTEYHLSGDTQVQQLLLLVEQFKQEQSSNACFRQIIDELQHFQNSVDGAAITGLKTKLSNGGREDLLDFAQKTKENFTKKLLKFQMYESAQKIYAFLLGDIYNKFNLEIMTLIKAGASNDQVSHALQTKVIDPVIRIIPENVCDLYPPDIAGMVFFLTGNCHLKWER